MRGQTLHTPDDRRRQRLIAHRVATHAEIKWIKLRSGGEDRFTGLVHRLASSGTAARAV